MTTFTTDDRKSAMDAYKLADELEFNVDIYQLHPAQSVAVTKAAYILRMQAYEITALRKQLISATNALMEKR